jgi:prephenate dehydratase
LKTPAKLRIAYQGEPGANSHIACLEVYPEAEPVALATFEEAFAAVEARSRTRSRGGWPTSTI